MSETLYVLVWCLVAIQSVAIAIVIYQNHQLFEIAGSGVAMPRGLAIGAVAPHFEALDLTKNKTISSTCLEGKRTLLLFVTTDCSRCQKIVQEMSVELKDCSTVTTRLMLICHGSKRGCLNLYSNVPSGVSILAGSDTEIAKLFHLSAMPAAVLLDRNWQVESYKYPSESRHILDDLTKVNRDAHFSATEVSNEWAS